MQARIKIEAKIVDGKITYAKKAFEKLQDFKKAHENTTIDLMLESHDTPEYWQHKYYRGFVLPIIARAQGEKNIYYLHEFVLKEKFLKFKIEKYDDIPKRHLKKCRAIEKNGIIYYLPSTGVLNFVEFREYILNCEAIRDGLIDWSVQDTTEMQKIRKLARI